MLEAATTARGKRRSNSARRGFSVLLFGGQNGRTAIPGGLFPLAIYGVPLVRGREICGVDAHSTCGEILPGPPYLSQFVVYIALAVIYILYIDGTH